jgi:putative beta-barrel porin BBP2
MSSFARVSAAIALGVFAISAVASAQTQPADPVQEARMRLGVVGVSPRFGVTNIGVDTNVFNSAINPQRDYTFTVRPSLDLWLRTKRGLLSANGRSDLVYFQKFHSQRAVNAFGSIQYEYPFNRVRPFVRFEGTNAYDRPGYEIDVRARRFEHAASAGVDVRVGGKSFLELSGRRQETKYADGEMFNGQALDRALNRTVEALDLTWRQRLTVLTTWVVRGSGERERFQFETRRHADSVKVETGFELGRLALIRGRAFAGYRRLQAAAGGTMPQFSGVTANVDASYTAPSQTRVNVATTRDLQYSYDVTRPYYVQTGWTGSVTQHIVGQWDLRVLGGRETLAYRSYLATPREPEPDFVNRFGGGIGYQLGGAMRVSFDVESVQRESRRPEANYKSIRAGASVTYGY